MSRDGSGVGSAREEAERLVAAGLAAASTALHGIEANRQLRGLAEQVFGADRVHDLAAGLAGFVSGLGSAQGDGPAGHGPAGHGPAGHGPAGHGPAGHGPTAGSPAGPSPAGLSTGSADCCVCPVCRLIAVLRNPSPEVAERLASAAGDLAVGMSGFLRALSGAVPRPGHDTGDDPWRAATTATTPPASPPPASPPPSAKPVAKKAMAKKAVAKKAVAKKAVAKKAVAKQAVAKQVVAKQVVAKKAAAKKAVRKAVPRDPDGAA